MRRVGEYPTPNNCEVGWYWVLGVGCLPPRRPALTTLQAFVKIAPVMDVLRLVARIVSGAAWPPRWGGRAAWLLAQALISYSGPQHAAAQVAFAPAANYVLGREPFAVVAAAVNGDGKMDLISANVAEASLTVWTNNGSGLFYSNATYAAGAANSVTAADVNGDGKVDLITGNSSFAGDHSTMMVLTNDGSGRFLPSSSLSPPLMRIVVMRLSTKPGCD